MNAQVKLVAVMSLIAVANTFCVGCTYRPPDRVGQLASGTLARGPNTGDGAAHSLLESTPAAFLDYSPGVSSAASTMQVELHPLSDQQRSTDPSIVPESVDPRCFTASLAGNSEVLACPGNMQLH